MKRATALTGAFAVLMLLTAAFLSGYQSTKPRSSTALIALAHGIPVGVVDTPAGALAATDNYVASEDNALLSPFLLRQVVDTDWSPPERSVELSGRLASAALASTPAGLGNARLTAAVAGHRLDAFSARSARVSVWHEVTVWSSAPPVMSPPAQHWSLDTVGLVWDNDRWLVASHTVAPPSATPVPAWTSGAPSDRTNQAFTGRLAGMSAPYYGSAS